jgi:secreted PhoX family phosphatase
VRARDAPHPDSARADATARRPRDPRGLDDPLEDVISPPSSEFSRREFLHGAMAGAAALSLGDLRAPLSAALDRDRVVGQIAAQHDATVRVLREWIALPSIAAEDIGYPEGPEYMARLKRVAGFQHVEIVPTSGKAGVFATLDAGAPPKHAIYFMYDV